MTTAKPPLTSIPCQGALREGGVQARPSPDRRICELTAHDRYAWNLCREKVEAGCNKTPTSSRGSSSRISSENVRAAPREAAPMSNAPGTGIRDTVRRSHRQPSRPTKASVTSSIPPLVVNSWLYLVRISLIIRGCDGRCSMSSTSSPCIYSPSQPLGGMTKQYSPTP